METSFYFFRAVFRSPSTAARSELADDLIRIANRPK